MAMTGNIGLPPLLFLTRLAYSVYQAFGTRSSITTFIIPHHTYQLFRYLPAYALSILSSRDRYQAIINEYND